MPVPPWCAGRTIYHLYVRSFQDSDGDGYGDLKGILGRLDYLQWLGVEGIWLSPCMPSADQDWGYDVTDYRAIHPDFGTLEDMAQLCDQAGRRGIRVLLDLVPNHTSDQHPWFISARQSTDSPYRDYYVWAPGKSDGTAPTNWIDDIGEPAWTFDQDAGEFYMHNFLATQPDLNWWNPDVQREFAEILDFWFDRGVSGFRIDVANGLFHDKQLRDNPLRSDATIYSTTVQGRYGQEHRYNFNQPEVHDVYRQWRTQADSRPNRPVLIGETWVARIDELAPYYGDNDELHLCMNFPFLFTEFRSKALAAVVAASLEAFPAGACPVWVGSNHDVSRLATRWAHGDPQRARLTHTVLATLPGTYIVYYGDELGMTDSDIPAALQRDPLTVGGRNNQWPRDNARAPMRWERSASGGFSTGKPWLPTHPDPSCNVADQRSDPSSMLQLVRTLLRLRRDAFAGSVVDYTEISVDDNLWVFKSGPLTVSANFGDHPTAVHLASTPVLSSHPDRDPDDLAALVGEVDLYPWEAVIEGPSRFTNIVASLQENEKMSTGITGVGNTRNALQQVGARKVSAYVTGNVGMNLLFQSVAVYLLYFYTDVLGLTAAAAGTVLLVARIVDLVADPVIGVAIDRTRSRWGKFRPYLLFGPVPLGVLGVLCFTAPSLGDGTKFLYAAVIYSLFSIAYAVVNVAYASMLPGLTSDYYQRGSISGIRELVGTVAILVVNSGTLFFVQRFDSEAIGFPVVMAVYCVVAVLTLWVVFAGSKRDGGLDAAAQPSKPVAVRAMLRTLAGNTPLYRVLGFNFASIMASGVHLSAMVYFFKYNVGQENLFPPFQLITTLAMFAAMVAVPTLVNRTGKRTATIVSQVITIAGLGGLFVLSHEVVMVFVMGSIASAGFGMTRAVIWGIVPDTVEYGQWRSGERAEGVVYAAFIGVEKLGSAAAGLVVGLVLSATGFIANVAQSSEALFGVLSLLTLVPIAATVLVIIVMAGYRLDGAKFNTINEQLAARSSDGSNASQPSE